VSLRNSSSFVTLRKKNHQKRQGVYLVKMGVQIATRPTWAFRMFLQKVVASRGSNLARLGELGGKLLPYFLINRGRSEGEKCSALLVF